MPLIISLWIATRRAAREEDVQEYSTPYKLLGLKRLLRSLFWQLDLIGIFLLIGVLALILVPFTVASGLKETWAAAHVIAPLVVGVLLIPGFVLWERRAPHPIVPFKVSETLR